MSEQNSGELPDYGHKCRLPFKIAGGVLYDERGISANLVRVDMTEDYGMSKNLALCLQRSTTCVGCGRAPFPIEQHAQCKRDSIRVEDVRRQVLREPDRTYVRETRISYVAICQILFATGQDVIIADEMRRDGARANKFLRKLHRPRGGRLALVRQKQELISIHQGHCYYCFGEIEPTGESADLDHFEPIAFGGTGAIWNLVVACKSCNHDKETVPGAEFRAAVLRRLDELTRRAAAVLQTRVDEWRQKALEAHKLTVESHALRRRLRPVRGRAS